MKRNYKVRFSIDIGDSGDKSFRNTLKMYISKWSAFIKQVIRLKLSSIPHNGTLSVCELPELRDYLKHNEVKTERIIGLLTKKRADLARLHLEAFPLFDKSPIALKAHILAVYGVSVSELRQSLGNSSPE